MKLIGGSWNILELRCFGFSRVGEGNGHQEFLLNGKMASGAAFKDRFPYPLHSEW